MRRATDRTFASSLWNNLAYIWSNRVRARYIGWLGHGNLGDEVLFQAIDSLFNHDIQFFSSRRMGILSRVLGRYLPVRAVFLGGGTLIRPTPSEYWVQLDESFSIFPRAKFVAFGTGVADAALWESFGRRTDKVGWCRRLERLDRVLVRGPLSKQHLLDWGFSGTVEIIGDMAIWFTRSNIARKRKARRVGLNLGPSNGCIRGRDERSVIRFGARLLRCFAQNGWRVTLFPMWAEDIPYMLEAVKEAECPLPPIHVNFLDRDATLTAIESQDVFVGEKLHSVVLASCVGTPAIMLEYRTKCRDFMLCIDREEWTYPTDELDADLIFGRLEELYEDVEEHQNRIHTQMLHWKRKLEEAAEDVWSLVNTI